MQLFTHIFNRLRPFLAEKEYLWAVRGESRRHQYPFNLKKRKEPNYGNHLRQGGEEKPHQQGTEMVRIGKSRFFRSSLAFCGERREVFCGKCGNFVDSRN